LRRNCLLKHVIEGEVEGRLEVTEKRVKRSEVILDDGKEKRRYWKLKEETRYRSLWINRFGRDYGLILR